MFLIIDTNVLFASFGKHSKVERLISGLRRKGTELLAPEFMYSELKALIPQINKYAELSTAETEETLLSLKKIIKEIPAVEYS